MQTILSDLHDQFSVGVNNNMTESKTEPAKKLLVCCVPAKDVVKNLGVSVPTPYRWVPVSAHA